MSKPARLTDIRWGNDRTEEGTVRDLTFGDFLLSNFGTEVPILGLAIYEDHNNVFALSTQGVPWFLNQMKLIPYLGINSPVIRRYPPCLIDGEDMYVMNDRPEYNRRKAFIQEEYRTHRLMTDLVDVLHYLLFRQYQLSQYREHLRGIFAPWYRELGTFFSTPHQYLPRWIFDQDIMTQLCTDHFRYHPSEDIHTTALATRIRNGMRQSPASLTSEQITYLNQFSERDGSGILLLPSSTGWLTWYS